MQNQSGTANVEADDFNTVGKQNAFRISWKRTLMELVILALSGAGMTLAFAPANISFFAWVCVIPLIWLTAARTKKRAFLYGLVWGWFWHFTGTFFLREIVWAAPFAFAVVLGLFNAVFAMLIPPVCKNLLYPLDIRRADADVRRKFYQYPVSGEFAAAFTLSTLWVLLEWIRSWIFTGFPWNLLAASQWQNFSVIQICEYTGVFGISFLVIFVNVSGYLALHGFRFSLPEGKYKRPFPLILAIVMVIAANAWGVNLYRGAVKTMKGEQIQPFAVGVVQPHLSQRRAGTTGQSDEALSTCFRLSQELISKEKQNAEGRRYLASLPNDAGSASTASDLEMRKDLYPLELIVWPESAVPRAYYALGDYERFAAAIRKQAETDPAMREKLRAVEQKRPFEARYREIVRGMLADFPQVRFLIGTINYSDNGEQCFNSAILLKNAKPDLSKYNYDLADVYSKVHLVPFGEFVPLAKHYPILDQWVGLGRSLSEGPGFRPMELRKGIRAGVMICYEDVFSTPARELARNGANFLLDITNDAWYPKSSEPEQHYINSIFRTVETRLPMVRVGNSNYSVLIDPYGRLIDSATKSFTSDGDAEFQPERKRSASAKFLIPVPKQPRMTFYTQFGDVFVLLCGIVFACGAGLAIVRAWLFAKTLIDPIKAERERIRMEFLNSEKKRD